MDPKLLSINNYLALVVVLINFLYAILVLARTSRAALYNVFVFICLSNIVWNFGDFMSYLTEARSWFYFQRTGSSMLPALMFHLVFILVMPKGRSMFSVLLVYLLSGLLALVSFSAIFSSGVQWFMDRSVSSILYLILLGPFLFAGIIMVLKALKEAKAEDEKQWLRYFSASAIIGVSTGLTDLVGYLYRPIPPLGHLGCLIYSSVLAIGVFKHRAAYDILAEMRKKLEDLSQIATGIAHEIRNPMTSIKGASSLLGKELKNFNDPEGEEYNNLIAEEIERIDKILSGFQFFTQPLAIEKDLVSINEVIQNTAKLAEVGALSLGIRLELSPDLPMVNADPSLMKQVFLNLLKNAAEACQAGGQLIIKTEQIPPFVKISFSDNGPGIPPKIRDHIFDPFFTTKPTGMGIGLSISRRIVQAHDGRIEIDSLLPEGAQVSIFIPV
jgi:signal transduction histidine kinase